MQEPSASGPWQMREAGSFRQGGRARRWPWSLGSPDAEDKVRPATGVVRVDDSNLASSGCIVYPDLALYLWRQAKLGTGRGVGLARLCQLRLCLLRVQDWDRG